LRRSSIGLHSFQGMFALPQKARLCNPCLRNELSPLSQEGHNDLREFTVWAAQTKTVFQTVLSAGIGWGFHPTASDIRQLRGLPNGCLNPFLRSQTIEEQDDSKRKYPTKLSQQAYNLVKVITCKVIDSNPIPATAVVIARSPSRSNGLVFLRNAGPGKQVRLRAA